jgi:hypothetical protein
MPPRSLLPPGCELKRRMDNWHISTIASSTDPPSQNVSSLIILLSAKMYPRAIIAIIAVTASMVSAAPVEPRMSFLSVTGRSLRPLGLTT